MVTLRVTGITVATGISVEPLRMSVVSVVETVVRESEGESEDEGDGEPEPDEVDEGSDEVDDWAQTEAKSVERSSVAAHDGVSRGRIAEGGEDDGGGRITKGGKRKRQREGAREGLYEDKHSEMNEGGDEQTTSATDKSAHRGRACTSPSHSPSRHRRMSQSVMASDRNAACSVGFTLALDAYRPFTMHIKHSSYSPSQPASHPARHPSKARPEQLHMLPRTSNIPDPAQAGISSPPPSISLDRSILYAERPSADPAETLSHLHQQVHTAHLCGSSSALACSREPSSTASDAGASPKCSNFVGVTSI